MPSDKRKSKRQVLTCRSSIVLLDSKQKIDCRLADISAAGAKIIIDKPDELPDDFVLMLSERGKIMRLCHVIRRGDRQVGVRFRMK